MKRLKALTDFLETALKNIYHRSFPYFFSNVYFGKHMGPASDNAIIFFPYKENVFYCGLAGIVSFVKGTDNGQVDMAGIHSVIKKIEGHDFAICRDNNLPFDEHYLGGIAEIDSLREASRKLKVGDCFTRIFLDPVAGKELEKISFRLKGIIQTDETFFSENMGRLSSSEVETISRRIEDLKDLQWCFASEILDNIFRVKELMNSDDKPLSPDAVFIFKKINSVLNSIDRIEVRGRDSAGISLMFVFEKKEFKSFHNALENEKLHEEFQERSNQDVLVNNCISIRESTGENGKAVVSVAIIYKIAAEIGSLGDNISFLRSQIINDAVLHTLVKFPVLYHTVTAHTRWASVGAITEPNCHPVDNATTRSCAEKNSIIHVCLNGDIDNYLQLKEEYENTNDNIPEDITTDTKIIPLQVEKYLNSGNDIEESFRLALNDFKGSHAISMHTDLAPGKIFLAQRGSGQAVFVGIAEDHYIPASEVYGFVEETPRFIKLDGEKVVAGKKGETQGQIFILDQSSSGGLAGISAMYYDGTPVHLVDDDINVTGITSRDIDRQGFPHYFLKEISESPVSVEKTLLNRWKISGHDHSTYMLTLDKTVVPQTIEDALSGKEHVRQIRRIYFVGQGTAGVAARACADILNYYMNDPLLNISSLKASELSGFKLSVDDSKDSLADALVIAISQSGTTTDTNRTVDMVKERGAHTIAIVNRRDSDITFKVDGVVYTSSGRDIEMSVASTKAFYSQIVAGAILGLHISRLKGCRNDSFVTEEIKELLKLPSQMRQILTMKEEIEASARRLAATKTYWAAVGSGPNKAAADEIRIKLSELCYKTISSDFVEDKKHIDLSSEPLIIVCAAGTRDTVIGDIVKDTAIFQAHKATSIVIADEGETRFDTYAEDIFHVPPVKEHLAPIVNTLVGHIWGYYAALAINEGSKILNTFREEIQSTIDKYSAKGLDIYEVILEKDFREKVVRFYNEFRVIKTEMHFPTFIAMASDLTLLFKYLSGRLPSSDFEFDFGKKGTPANMIHTLFECIGESINFMVRPVDAIKHQAKTVTVGTSRISEKLEGILFDTLAHHDIKVSQIISRNIIVLKNMQGIIAGIDGSILYKIGGMSLLGDLTDDTTIEVIRKEGVLKPIPSRVETDTRLKGTKRIITNQGNVYIGIGRKDSRSILVIPAISESSATPNIIEYLLLLNITFKEEIDLSVKKKALGGKFEHIKNIVQENSIQWDDSYLELIETKMLFGNSAEKNGETILSHVEVR